MRIILHLFVAALCIPVVTAQQPRDVTGSTESASSVFERAAPEPPAKRRWHTRMVAWQFEDRDSLSPLLPWRAEVDRRLQQWAELQNEDGSFGAEGQDRVRVTALATLAFSLRGHTLDSPRYGDPLKRATRWLLAHQDRDGRISVDGTEHSPRSQAQVTFALIDVSYSPDYPRFEYPGVIAHARRALDYLDSVANRADRDVWVTAVRAYATRAALRQPRTRSAPAPDAKLDWESSVVRAITRENSFEDGARLRAELPADELMTRFLGSDPDEAFFAAVAGRTSDATDQQRRTLYSWIAGEAVDGWEPAACDPVELSHANLMRTMQLEAWFLLLLSKARE